MNCVIIYPIIREAEEPKMDAAFLGFGFFFDFCELVVLERHGRGKGEEYHV